MLASWRSMTKIAGSGSGYRTKCHGSAKLLEWVNFWPTLIEMQELIVSHPGHFSVEEAAHNVLGERCPALHLQFCIFHPWYKKYRVKIQPVFHVLYTCSLDCQIFCHQVRSGRMKICPKYRNWIKVPQQRSAKGLQWLKEWESNGAYRSIFYASINEF